MKKILLCAFISLALLGGWVQAAQAASSWYICTVYRAGVLDDGSAFARLTDTAAPSAFANMTFSIPNIAKAEMLAVFLTAKASGLRVNIKVDIAAGTNPPLEAVYIAE